MGLDEVKPRPRPFGEASPAQAGRVFRVMRVAAELGASLSDLIDLGAAEGRRVGVPEGAAEDLARILATRAEAHDP